MSPSDTRLPAPLEAAISHVKATAQAVAERVAAGLGIQAQSSTRIMERDLLLATQIDLRRKMNAFHLTFDHALTGKVLEEVAPRADSRRTLAATDWQSLSLVDDKEVEQRMFSDRIAQQIAHGCEWELRELAAYMGAVLNLGRPDEERNPLRAEVLARAALRAIEAVTADADGRKLLARELGQALAEAMPACYQAIVRDLQQRHVQPVGLAVKTVHGPGHSANSGYVSLRDTLSSTRTVPADLGARTEPGPMSGAGPAVYGLFHHLTDAKRAARGLRISARTWVVAPVW